MLTNNKLVFNEKSKTTKKEILEVVSSKMVELGYLKDSKQLLKAFIDREKEFSTGMGGGIAIPHAEVEGLKEACISVVRVKDIDWDSLDKKPVKTVVAIMVPKGGRGEHLSILAELSKNMVKEDFANKILKAPLKDLPDLINSIGTNNDEEKKEKVISGSKFIIGITACPTGIAHTFMAQQKIIDAAKAKGYEVKVETQGSEGVKDKLTVEEIDRSDAIIISTGIALEGMKRFEGYEDKIHTSELQNTISKAPQVMKEALEKAKNFKPSKGAGLKKTGQQSSLNFAPEKTKFETGMGHIMTGIGAMIPILLIAGLLMAIGNIGALAWTIPNTNSIGDASYASDPNAWVNLMYYINQIGSLVMKFMYPVFAMYLAFSIGGKLALIPGLMGGIMAAGLETKFLNGDIYESPLLGWAYPNGFIPSMFFGALIIGFFAGTLTKLLNNKIQTSPNLVTLKTMLIIPLIMSVAVFLLMAFAVNPFFGWINYLLVQAFNAAGTSGTLLYQMSIAAGTAFDLGGPFNKAAGAVANGMNTDAFQALTDALASGDEGAIKVAVSQLQTFNITGRTLGIIVPPIGIGMAAIFGNKITQREIFTKEEQQVGGQAAFLGTIGISEGAIPMMIKYPVYVITADIIGSMVAATVATIFGSIQTLPLPAMWGWFLVGTTSQGAAAYGIAGIGTQIFGYILGMLIGVIVVASIFIGFLTMSDIRMSRKNKVYTTKKLDTVEEKENKTEMIKNSVNSINRFIEYYNNELTSLNCELDNKVKISKEELSNIELDFSKLKVSLGKKIKDLAKFNYQVMRNDQKTRVLNTKVELSKDNEKVNKYKEKINQNNSRNIELEEKIKLERKKISNYISIQIKGMEETKKILETYGK